MFGSLKKKSNESNPEILVKKNKNPIWNFFKNHETDKSKAVCALCGGNLSLGSEKPRNQTTTSIKNHLKTKHYSDFVKYTTLIEESCFWKVSRGFAVSRTGTEGSTEHWVKVPKCALIRYQNSSKFSNFGLGENFQKKN